LIIFDASGDYAAITGLKLLRRLAAPKLLRRMSATPSNTFSSPSPATVLRCKSAAQGREQCHGQHLGATTRRCIKNQLESPRKLRCTVLLTASAFAIKPRT
jgi:hypothetical protein